MTRDDPPILPIDRRPGPAPAPEGPPYKCRLWLWVGDVPLVRDHRLGFQPAADMVLHDLARAGGLRVERVAWRDADARFDLSVSGPWHESGGRGVPAPLGRETPLDRALELLGPGWAVPEYPAREDDGDVEAP